MKKICSILLAISLVLTSGVMAFASGSADKSLDKLMVSKSDSTSSSKLYDMFPEFDPKIADYSVFLPDGKDSVYIYMKAEDKDYTVYCQEDEIGKDEDYFAYVKNISDEDEIEIVVEDEDGDEIDTYTITFYCGDDDDNDEAALDELSIRNKTDSSTYKEISFSKKFDEDTTSYKCDVPANSYKTVRIYADPSDQDAHVFIDGQLLSSKGYLDVDVSSGKNDIKVKVLAENCDDMKTYTIEVNYAEEAKAILTSLTAKDSSGNNILISPAFYSNKQNYTTDVNYSVSSISFYLGTENNNSTVYVNNAVQTNSAWTQGFTLKEGVNNFAISVKATNGNSSDAATYNVSVYRQPNKFETFVSSQKLTINGVSKGLNAYNINGNNFVKLRDIASLLQGTTKQFSVGYDQTTNRISMLSGGYYTTNGQENLPLSQAKLVMPSDQPVYLDNSDVSIMSYNIDGNNFVMLRDLGLLFNFKVGYNSSSDTIEIVTTQNYTAN